MANPQPSWNELGLLLFPDWIVTRSSGGEEFETQIVRIGKTERRNSPLETGWQKLSLGGALIHEYELLEWNTFRALVKGALSTFLVRNIRHCHLNHTPIGVGDGQTRTFQIALRGGMQGQEHVWPVKYIDHNYPDRLFPDGRVCWPTQILRVWVGGVEMPWRGGWDVDRNTGRIVFDVAPPKNAVIIVLGFFLMRCRFIADYVPTSLDEESLDYQIPDGVEVIEVEA